MGLDEILCGLVRLITCDQTFGKDDGPTSPYPHWPEFQKKCRKAGLGPAAIAAFRYNYEKLASGANLMIPESEITNNKASSSLAAKDRTVANLEP